MPAKNKLIDPSIWALIRKWGFIKGDRIEEVLDKYLVKKFKDVKIPLHIVTCNLDRRSMRVFNADADPDMDLSLAVRASMSIPGVFVPVKLDGETYVDGGIAGNFMIDYFGNDPNVIGIRFRSVRGTYSKVRTAFDYTNAVIDTMLEANAAERTEDVPNNNVITIHSKYRSLDLNMTEGNTLDLIGEGYAAASAWLSETSWKYSPAAP
jgi:NTE family protein